MTDHLHQGNRFSQFISLLFHPLLMPSWAYGILIGFGDPVQHEQEWLWLWIYGVYVFTLTFVFPVTIFLVMLKYKWISALSMPDRKERAIPILIAATFFYILFHFSRGQEIDPIFGLYMLGATSLSLLSMLINHWWKISLHMLGTGGITAAVATLALFFSPTYFIALLGIVLVAGVTGYARLRLDAHKPAEVYTGFMIGFFFIFTLFAFAMGGR